MPGEAGLLPPDWGPQGNLRAALDPFEDGSRPDNKVDPSPHTSLMSWHAFK